MYEVLLIFLIAWSAKIQTGKCIFELFYDFDEVHPQVFPDFILLVRLCTVCHSSSGDTFSLFDSMFTIGEDSRRKHHV